MYTFNIYVFGHKMSKNPELNNALHSLDIEFRLKIKNDAYEIRHPYHGGQCYTKALSCVFGVEITDDDNEYYLYEIRNFNESRYISDYKLFIEALKKDLLANKGVDEDDDYDRVVDELIIFLDNNEPELYSVEASS